MKQVIIVNRKTDCTSRQKQLLRSATLAHRDDLDDTSGQAFALGKTSNARQFQQAIDKELHSRLKLLSQTASHQPRQVAAKTDRKLWTHIREKALHLKAGIIKKHDQGLENLPKSVACTCKLHDSRNLSFLQEKFSIMTLKNRIKGNDLVGYSKHIEFIFSRKAHMARAKRWLTRSVNHHCIAKQIATFDFWRWTIDSSATCAVEVELLTTLSILSFVRKLKS
jgi:hypothetical protein